MKEERKEKRDSRRDDDGILLALRCPLFFSGPPSFEEKVILDRSDNRISAEVVRRAPFWHGIEGFVGEKSDGSHSTSCSTRRNQPTAARSTHPTHRSYPDFPCPLGLLGSCSVLLASDVRSLLIYRAWFGHTSKQNPSSSHHTAPSL